MARRLLIPTLLAALIVRAPAGAPVEVRASLVAGQAADAAVARTLATQTFKDALAVIDRDHDRLVRETIQLTEIQSAPFKEAARAKVYVEMFRQLGLADVGIDPEGNVTGLRRGTGGGPLVAISAHLDTVFPEGTDVKVKRTGTRLAAPGVGDDTRSLAVLLAMVRAMDAAKVQTTSDLLFVGDVGEEGLGDLRGMKYLFLKGAYKDRIKAIICIDGVGDGDTITNAGVGSRRYRVTFKGPGGHSYGAFGLVSPAFAMGRAIEKLARVQVPAKPKTTFNVGVVGGGTSVNSIPFESWMEVDTRSESKTELDKLNQTFASLVHEAVDEENRARSTAQGKIEVDLKLVGDRPTGETPRDSALVQIAAAAIRAVGMTPSFVIGSTDANLPISLGIPAITIDSGGRGERAHSLDEWIDVDKTSSMKGIETALLMLLALAGIS